ncbi:MAG: NADH-quinone oxidoreductase subunit K [Anaerolineae bacterium]|jgi:multicomponent Na+:H+ antiporter subunit C
MRLLLALVIAGLYAAGFYMIMRRATVKVGMGLSLLGNAANLLIFVAAGLNRAPAPIVPPGQTAPVAPVADPLPQALILTAIVIGFGVLAFALVLIYRVHAVCGTVDCDLLRLEDSE